MSNALRCQSSSRSCNSCNSYCNDIKVYYFYIAFYSVKVLYKGALADKEGSDGRGGDKPKATK